jgi:HEPN domain-containing protein
VAEASSDLWIRQAESDLLCAGRVLDPNDATTFCHSIAKCQQSVEKSIKALVAALRDAGIINRGPTYSHDLEREINILKRLPHKPRSKDIVS